MCPIVAILWVYKEFSSSSSCICYLISPWALLGGPAVSSAGGYSSVPGRWAKLPHASWPKNQNIRQKRDGNRYNTLKVVQGSKKSKISLFLRLFPCVKGQPEYDLTELWGWNKVIVAYSSARSTFALFLGIIFLSWSDSLPLIPSWRLLGGPLLCCMFWGTPKQSLTFLLVHPSSILYTIILRLVHGITISWLFTWFCALLS